MKEIDKDQTIKIKDADLRKRGLEPASIRRWFKKNHGMTFQAYLRMLRINSAFKRIKYGEKVLINSLMSFLQEINSKISG